MQKWIALGMNCFKRDFVSTGYREKYYDNVRDFRNHKKYFNRPEIVRNRFIKVRNL